MSRGVFIIKKLCLIFITIFLLSRYISVEASIGDNNLGSNFYPINPLNDNSKPFDPYNSDIEKVLVTAPMAFTENQGQLENEIVRFYEQGGGIWFTDDGVWFEVREFVDTRGRGSQLRDQGGVSGLDFDPMVRFREPEPVEYNRVILKQEFVGANRVRPVGRERCSWNNNFFYGNDSSKWCTDVPNYREVYYETLYDGIDLRYYSNENGLKYDFIVHPYADIRQIKVRFEGADALELDNFDNLVIKTPLEDIIDRDLCIYQDYNDDRHYLRGKFHLLNKNEYGFEILGDYHPRKTIIIDPTINLEYSSFLGGSSSDYGYSNTVDSAGYAYVTGGTLSNDFPTTPGVNDSTFNNNNDVFVSKINPTGSTLVYSTYIGGRSSEDGYGIALDLKGNAYVTGRTYSVNFPTTPNAYDTYYESGSAFEVFVCKLNHNGSLLLYSTYIGGRESDLSYDIKVDLNGNAFITGYTWSSNFPTSPNAFGRTLNGSSDAFILKLNQSGQSILYSTFVGGGNSDQGLAIEIDSSGNAFVAGNTYSIDFPTTPGAYNRSIKGSTDIYVLKLNHNGSNLNYSTFIGGKSYEYGNGIAIESSGNAIITGYTGSSDFPTTKDAYDTSLNGTNDVIIFKLNQNGSKLLFSTFVGGSNYEYGRDIAVDIIGNIYVVGHTASTDFPITPDTYDSTFNGSYDVFMLKLLGNGSKLLFSTFLGGNSFDNGKTIALDPVGNAYITGSTLSSDFPTTSGALNRTINGGYDVFITKFSFRPFISISSLSLLRDEEPTSVVYTGLCPYTFRLNVIDTVSISDLKDVYLTLDPTGTNIQLLWNRSTGRFSEISDPNNYITINSSSSSYNSFHLWAIDFDINFNWYYPDEKIHQVKACATSGKLSTAWFNVSKFYRVENDLVFNGTLLVRNENNRILAENELVRGGEKLNWTGLIPIYEGSTNVYPPEEVFDLTLSDDEGNSNLSSPSSGEPFIIETIAPTISYPLGYSYRVSIDGIPPECDNTSESFVLRIDADNVSFSDPIPNNLTWHITTNVIVGINITDIGGGAVNSSTVMRSISTTNGTPWSSWESIQGLDSKTSIIVKDVVTLKDGKDNLIKWKAEDSVGNGPVISKSYRVLVDTQGVTFSNGWPSTAGVSTTENVEVGIIISDKTSGVDASSIEYSISGDKGKTWDAWKHVSGFQDGMDVVVHLNLTFPNGTNNVLRWRATDIGGNDPVMSPWQIINVNTWVPVVKPKVIHLTPPNGVTINKTTVEFSWELEDKSMENVTYSLYIDNETSPKIMITDIINTSYIVENLRYSEIYYWRVIPKIGNVEGICTSGTWWFKIDLSQAEKEKIFKITITGRDSISLFPGENKSITLSITNLGEEKDRIRLELEGGKLSDYIYLNDYSMLELDSNVYSLRELNLELPETIKPGNHVIMITAISLNSGETVKDTHMIEIEILDIIKPNGVPNGTDKNDTVDNITKDKSTPWLNEVLLFSIIAIMIIIICLGLAIFVLKRKKRADQGALFPGSAYTIKPGALPSQVITIEQVSGAPAIQQLPGTSIAGVSPQPTAVAIPTPTLASTTTATPIPPFKQIPQVQQLPQLPPAQTPTIKAEASQVTPIPTVVTPTLTSTPSTPSPPEIQKVSNPSSPQTISTRAPPSTPTLAPTQTQSTVAPTATVTQTPKPSGPEVHLPESSLPSTEPSKHITPLPTIVRTTEESEIGGSTPTITESHVNQPTIIQEPEENKVKNKNEVEEK